jgi:hypothetical protein
MLSVALGRGWVVGREADLRVVSRPVFALRYSVHAMAGRYRWCQERGSTIAFASSAALHKRRMDDAIPCVRSEKEARPAIRAAVEAASHGGEAVHYRLAGCVSLERVSQPADRRTEGLASALAADSVNVGRSIARSAGPTENMALAAPVGESGVRC